MSGALWLMVLGLGYFAPLPRRSLLYPISRSRRARLAFCSSVVWWGSNLALWIGLPLAAAAVTGLVSDLPVTFAGAARFAAPAALSIPLIAFLRWGALQFEGVSNVVLLFIAIAAFPITIITWVIGARLDPADALVVCLCANGLGLAIYYALLHDIYEMQDLVRPGADQPLRFGLLARDSTPR